MTVNIDELVEVQLKESDDFLKVKETLTRIGIAAKKDNVLFQSCHILHKQGRYYIVHFKELFALDGKPTNFSDEDKARRNTIVKLLAEWGLVDVMIKDSYIVPQAPLSQIKVIAHKDKNEWTLEPKYNIGRRK
ncbi:MAG: translation repressor protein [Puniceicoccaceae bacterium TMED149]|nr:MAG: translation repressor protein [Puniceicoccaceae bacterium TMED149]